MKKILFVMFALTIMLVSCDKNDKSPCDGVDCSGHGTCNDSSGRAVCECEEGFVPSGQLECVEATDPCAGVDCEEWEQCANGDCNPLSGRCNEDEDCVGSETCDTETHTCVGPCSEVDCGGHGDCKEGGYGSGSGSGDYESGIYCDCEDGYVQVMKDDEPTCVDENSVPDSDSSDEDDLCAGIDCSDHGDCVITDNKAECDCDKGYEADDLECVLDPCAGVACEEWEQCNTEGNCELLDGKCVDNDDCTSPLKCDIVAHECIEDKCVAVDCGNGGVCTIEGGEAVCNCTNGFKADGTSCVADSDSPTWIGVQWPYTITGDVGTEGDLVYGQIYNDDGTTGGDVAEHFEWKAQLGIKKDVTTAEYPVLASTWRWIDASFNDKYEGNNHEYMAGFPMDEPGSFSYIFRFSLNSGDSWWYCDKGVDGGTGPSFITSATNNPGQATIKGQLCGAEVCTEWEECNVDECILKEDRCNKSDDCATGYECDGTNTCVASEVELVIENLTRTDNSYSFDVVYSGADDIDMTESEVTLNGVDVTDDVTYEAASKTFKVSKTGLDPNKYSYLFKLKNSSGDEIEPLFVPIWIGDGIDFADFNWRDAFIYQLMTDRFSNGDATNDVGNLAGITEDLEQWQGGDFRGIINKIKEDYFTALGVNALWISSPVLNPHTASEGGVNPSDRRKFTSYHAYHPVASGYSYTNDYDYTSALGFDEGPIDTAFGTIGELHELIAEAHKKGIRVIPDFVANHVHSDSNLYSDNPGWFFDYVKCDGNWDSHRIDCWFTEYMPDFDFAGNPGARKAMVDHAIWLIQEFNFDGFRADALKHMDDVFVKELKSAVISKIETTVENHDLPDEAEIFYMVGESLGGWARYHTRVDMVQGQVNEDFYSNAKNYLLWGNGNMSDLASWTVGNDTTFLTEQSTMGGAGGFPGAVMGNFFGNHDQDRALSECGEDYNKLKHAQTYLMTAPINVPMLYQGDDIGMTGRASDGYDSGRRAVMKFTGLTTAEQDALNHMQDLGMFRKEYAALRYGKRETCSSSNDAWVYKLTHDGETVIVGINRGSSSYSGTCSGVSGTFDSYQGSDVNISGGNVTVPANGSLVLGKK